MTKKQNLSLENLENLDNSQSNFQKLNLEKLPEKFPETLEEQRDYYLNLFRKWEMWQQETPEKLPEGFRTKEEFDFEEGFELLNYESTDFFKLAENDGEIEQIYFNNYFIDENINLSYKDGNKKPDFLEINKPIVFAYAGGLIEKCEFWYMKGKLNLKCVESVHIRDKRLKFENCEFENITLENFDRGYFSPETNEYLNQMESEGKLILINCTWSGLPTLRENLEMEEENINNKNSVKFDFTKYIQSEYRDIFADFFMGVKSFVQYTRGVEMSIKISVNGQLLVEIEAEESELENIIRSFQEYVINILPIISDQKPEITSTLINNSSTALIFLQNKVNSLEIQSQLRNNNLIGQTQKEHFFVEIIQKLQEEKYFLQLENYQLKDNNAELLIKVDKLNTEIQKLQIQKMDQKDEIMIKLLLNSLGQLRLALDSKDPTLIKYSANVLKNLWQEHQWKITLAFNSTKLIINNKDQILAFIQYIITESLKKF